MAEVTVVDTTQANAQLNALLTRQRELESLRSEWNSLWEEIFRYFPRRPYKSSRGGNLLGKEIYDGTPSGAAQILTDGMQGYLCSPSFNWFKVGMEPEALDDLPGIRGWLQEVERHLYYVLRVSNFYAMMNEYFYDAATVGTATLYVEEDANTGRIVFSCRHPEEIYVAEDRWGQVDTVMRKSNPTLRQLVMLFGDTAVPEQLLERYRRTPDEKVELVHWVYPRNDRAPWKVDRKNMPWISIYLLPIGKKILREAGYRTLPYHVWRWRKNSNEVYGRSPAADSIYDIQGINKSAKASMIVAQKEAEPPVNVPEEMEGRVRLVPNGMNYYESPERVITEMRVRGNPTWLLAERERIQQIIERNFKVKYWLMLNEAQQKSMTATQVMEMAGEKAAVLGPNIGRLDSECLQPLFERIYDIEDTAGRMPPPPEVLLATGGQLNIQVMGPLAQAQRKLFQTQGILQSMEVVAPMTQMFPQITDVIDPDILARELLQAYGFPQQALRDPKLVAAMRKARAQELQAQANVEKMKGMSETARNLATPTPPGSPLDQIMSGQAPLQGARGQR
jgi:hypothetical protein